jgi:hypothetical protein
MTPIQPAKSSECFEFVWRRSKKRQGFAWEQVKGRWLLSEPPEEDLVAYEPLVQETGLFLTFAHLDGTDAEFLRFANTYGRLGTYHYYFPGGEPLEEWQRHHRWMQFLALLRGELLERRPGLKKHVNWEGNEVVYRFPKIGTSATELWRHRGERRECPLNMEGLPLFKPGDLRGPTWWFLVFAINDWFEELKRFAPVAPRMIWSEEDRRPQFAFGPSSLIGAMVCQFAAALHGGWPFRECAQCHKFFRLAPGVNRANRVTCSRTCKQYLYHRRVDAARRLHAKGRTDSQIVKKLHVRPQGNKSSTEIVKSWVTQDSGNDRV